MNAVAITGMGVFSPLGSGVEEFRSRLLAGESGVGPLTLFPAGSLPSRIAGECAVNGGYKDRKITMGLSAAEQAMAQAEGCGKPLAGFYPDGRRVLSLGVGLELFDMDQMTQYAISPGGAGSALLRPMDYLQTPADLCASVLAGRFGLAGNPAIHVSACAAGADAIGHAFLRIRRGAADMALAGGTDSMINPLGVGGFCLLRALSTRNGDPKAASRPFDAARDGFVLGEGAGMLVLENMGMAEKRGAVILGEVAGYGNSFDGHSVSDPHPEGRGAALAMGRALASAGIGPEMICYINAHGTSTPKNDPVEVAAIKKVFGEGAYRIPVSSTKSMIGHLISAAGAVEAVAGLACANAGWVHPTINLARPDPLCDLDFVAEGARRADVDYFMSSSFAFGGQNAVLVFRRGRHDA